MILHNDGKAPTARALRDYAGHVANHTRLQANDEASSHTTSAAGAWVTPSNRLVEPGRLSRRRRERRAPWTSSGAGRWAGSRV